MMLPTILLRRARILVVAGAVCATSACAPVASTGYERVVDVLGAEVTLRRDWAGHPGPRWCDLDPALKAAAREATSDAQFDIALARLIDALEDGHASVVPTHAVDVAQPRGVRFASVDREHWVSIGEPIGGPIDAGGDAWAQLVAIDGYAPKTRAGADILLSEVRREGDEPREPAPVTLTLALRDGRRVEARYERVWWSEDPSWIARRTGYEFIWFPSRLVPHHDNAGMPAWLSVGRIGTDRDVGYLRVFEGLNPRQGWESHDACSGDALDCTELAAIDAALLSLRGCRAIILDLQGCRGGTCAHGGRIAGWLFPPSITSAPFSHAVREYVPLIGEPLGWTWTSRVTWKLPAPSARIAWDQLVILVDGSTGSAAEHIPACFRDVAGATIVGMQTSGSEYSLERYSGRKRKFGFGGKPGIWAPPLTTVEQRGVTPDVVIAYNESVIARRGPSHAIELQRRASLAEALRIVGLEPEEWLVPAR